MHVPLSSVGTIVETGVGASSTMTRTSASTPAAPVVRCWLDPPETVEPEVEERTKPVGTAR